MKAHTTLVITGLTLICSLMADEPLKPSASIGAVLRPAQELQNMEAKEESIQSVLENNQALGALDLLKAPIVLKSMEDALKHLTRDSIKKIKVDFEKEQVAIFVWKGSGQDQLRGRYHIDRVNHNHMANFHYVPGRTRDLRTHSAIYLMPKGAEISVR